jgi:anti-sigma regulatory factor (Ser/Thr protein kinase)
MTGDAFKTEPVGGVGRAAPASAQAPLLDQEFDSGTLYALRAAVQAHAGQAGLSEDRVGEVVLAIHELAANAIAHGAGHGRLRMWERADALSCEVVDAGPAGAGRPTGPSDSSPGPSDSSAGPSDSPPGPSEAVDPWPAADGHGLWLVRQVADQLDLRSGPHGTRAMAIFALRRPEDH